MKVKVYFLSTAFASWRRLIGVAAMTLLSFGLAKSQTVLIDPTLEGGFELGSGNFSDNGWTVVNSTTTQWHTGTVPGWFEGNGAFISNDNGITWAYSTGTAQRSHFYRDVTFPANEPNVTLTFDWRGNGNDTGWDNLLVYVVDTDIFPNTSGPTGNNTTTTGWTGYTNGSTGYFLLNRNGTEVPTTTTQVNYTLTSAQAAYVMGNTKRIIFTWKNDGSGGANPPASVDNISLTSSCLGPNSLAASNIALTSAQLNWNTLNGATGYNVEYRVSGTDTWIANPTNPISDTSIVLNGLLSNTTYQFRVAAVGEVCNLVGNTVNFTTPIPNQIGTGTNLTATLPISSNYGFTYSQQIYLGSEFDAVVEDGHNYITKVRFFYNGTSSSQTPSAPTTTTTFQDWRIFMVNTNKASFSSTTDWISVSESMEVFNGVVTFPAPGNWMEITFDTPFIYDGSSNIAVCVHEYTPSYASSTYWRSSTVSNRSIYYRIDAEASNPNPLSPPTASSYTSNILNHIQFETEELPSCVMPTSVAVTNVTAFGATISWVASQSNPAGGYAWEVLDSDDVIVDSGIAMGTSAEVTSLLPLSAYTFEIRSICEEGIDESSTTSTSFSTVASCLPPTSLVINTVSNTAVSFSWLASPSAPAGGYFWEVLGASNTVVDSGSTMDTTASSISLTANTNYTLRVKSMCEEEEESVWTNTIAFYTGYCVIPANSSSDATGITHFGFNTIDFSSDSGPAYYQDHTDQSTTVHPYGIYDLSARVNTAGNFTVNVKAWIDWNQNLQFEPSEEYDLGSAYGVTDGSTNASPLSITVPANALLGSTTLRLRGTFNNAPNTCGAQSYSQVEDYTVVVVAPPSCLPPSQLATSDITDTGATLSWNPSVSEPAEGYFWQILDETDLVVASGNTADTSVTVSTLEQLTAYNIQVQAICEADVDSSTWVAGSFLTVASCLPPSAVAVSGITSSTADLSWSASTSFNEGGYAWEVRTSDGTVAASGTTLELEDTALDLEPNTGYTLFVQAICTDADQSIWVNSTAFQTLCVPITTFFTEGFNTIGSIPSCWSATALTGSNWQIAATDGDNVMSPHSGSGLATKNWTSSATTAQAILVSPAIDYSAMPDTESRINVWIYRKTSNAQATDRIAFFLNTTPDLNGTPLQLLDISLLASVAPTVTTTGWHNYTANIPLSYHTDGNFYVIARGTTTSSFSSYSVGFDDFAIEPVPSCDAVTQLDITTLSASNVSFNWTASASEATNYSWQVLDANDAVVASGSTTDLFATASGLSAESTYTISVVANCGAELSSAASTLSIETPCAVIVEFPYVESFEEDSEWLSCWTLDNGYVAWDFGYGSEYGDIETPHTGESNAYLYGGEYSYADLISPIMDLSSLTATGAEVNFWYANPEYDGEIDELEVYYRTSPTSSWQIVPGGLFYSAVEDWTEVTLTLPNISSTYQLSFFGYSTWAETLVLDDVIVRAIAPACEPVTDVAVSQITENGATITWEAPEESPQNGYDWTILDAEDEVVASGNTSNTFVTVSTLAAGTEYSVSIVTVCDNEDSSESTAPVEFSTSHITGCTDETACNYNPDATEDDDSCSFEPLTWYLDADGDGYGDASETEEACQQPEGYVANNTDCDDTNADVYQTGELYIDADGDGYDAGLDTLCYGATVPAGYAIETLGTDCDDTNADVYQTGELYIDADGDGYNVGVDTLCYGATVPAGYAIETLGTDCDDEDATVYRSAELYVDADGDGYDAGSETVCYGEEIPEGYTTETLGTDCNDEDATVYQSATLYIDTDGDGYHGLAEEVCFGEEIPDGFVTETAGTDCNDEDETVWALTTLEVNLVLPVATICDNASPLTLTGGSPENGVWSGQTVVDGVFYPAGLAATNYTITYTVAGDGVCIEGNEASAVLIVDDCSSIDEQAINTIHVYPTITSDFVLVAGHSLLHAVVMDMNGKSIKTVSLNTDATIDMQSLAAGVYFIQVSSHTTTEVFRVVKVN